MDQGKRCNVQISLSIQMRASLYLLYGEEEAEQIVRQCALLVMGINSHEDIQYFSSFVKEPFISEEDKRAAISYMTRGEAFWVDPYERKGQFIKLLDREEIQENSVDSFPSSEKKDPTLIQMEVKEIVKHIFKDQGKGNFFEDMGAQLLECLSLYVILEHSTDYTALVEEWEDNEEKMDKVFESLDSDHPAYKAYIPFKQLKPYMKTMVWVHLKTFLSQNEPLNIKGYIQTSLHDEDVKG
jgi:hypothetical protein